MGHLLSRHQHDLLVRLLIERLSTRAEVRTLDFARAVWSPGGVRTDLLWSFVDAAGTAQRVAFSTPAGTAPLTGARLQRFRASVDALPGGVPTTGVCVLPCPNPFHRRLRDTHGVAVVDLTSAAPCRPSEVAPVEITAAMVQPLVQDVRFETVERYVDDVSRRERDRRRPWVLTPQAGHDGESMPLDLVLAGGELGSFGEPCAVHPVRRTFDVPRVLSLAGRPVALVAAVTASVGAVERPPVTMRVSSLRTLGWMLSVTLRVPNVWGACKGRSWSTTGAQYGSAVALA